MEVDVSFRRSVISNYRSALHKARGYENYESSVHANYNNLVSVVGATSYLESSKARFEIDAFIRVHNQLVQAMDSKDSYHYPYSYAAEYLNIIGYGEYVTSLCQPCNRGVTA